jgi:PAS domain S-box-containing protein
MDILSNKKDKLFQKIFTYSNDAIIVFDPENDRILDANPNACKILGYSKKELITLPVSAIHPHELPRMMKFARSVITKCKGWTNELSCITKSGSSLPSEISASVIDIEGTNNIVAFIRDISKRKASEKALQKMNEVLEQRITERTAALSKANKALHRALDEVEQLKNRLEAENVYLQQEIKLTHNFEEIVTGSDVLKKVLRKVEQVASTDSTVLILGETGTGKELFARAIHNISNRQDRPLVKVNCATLPVNLIESVLFGHERGPFTGALSKKIGRFELADGGTIFLDEIGDLPLELQSKLLRILQEGEFGRVGSSRIQKVDVRVIAATNRDLQESLRQGTFREDLFYRLNVFPIDIPPLRDRIEDIPLLANHFLNKHGIRIGKKIEIIPKGVIEKLQTYPWPGNVRELENILERAIIVNVGSELQVGDWLPQKNWSHPDPGIQDLHDIQREHILKVLHKTNWRDSGEKGAAKLLGIKAPPLVSKMQKLGIERQK